MLNTETRKENTTEKRKHRRAKEMTLKRDREGNRQGAKDTT